MAIQDVVDTTQIEQAIKQSTILNDLGTTLSGETHKAILNSDEQIRDAADILHGKWLGHPLHPVLTDVTIGAWVFGALFDFLSIVFPRMRRQADTMTKIGTVMAVPTAITGLTDYSGIKKDAVAHGTLHGILNSVVFGLYVLSIRARDNGNRGRGILLSTIAVTIATMSAWLGGEMVYRFRVGVNHSEDPTGPEDWTPIMSETSLKDETPKRVEVEELPVLLYRRKETVYAIGAVCSHAGGPLEEGSFNGVCVQCPWHDSVYDLRDGSAVHGPTTYSQPAYEARIRDGQIEIRVAERTITR